MAEHRYGKEELLQLFCEDPIRPQGMPLISPITRTQALTPLAFMPLSEEEQVRILISVSVVPNSPGTLSLLLLYILWEGNI